MPFGFCRDCTYCRCYGQTVKQALKENNGSDLADWQWHCMRHAPVIPRTIDTRVVSLETFPILHGVDVLDKAIGCGEFELDQSK